MNKKKYIIIISLIVIIIISIVVFIINSREKINYRYPELKGIYEKKYYRNGVRIYDNNNLTSENISINYGEYIIFTDNYIKYINNIIDKTYEFDYTYSDGIININGNNVCNFCGERILEFEDNSIRLIRKVENSELIFYFEYIP